MHYETSWKTLNVRDFIQMIFGSDIVMWLQMTEIMNESKSLVFTGHSIGGAIASLSALWLLSFLGNTSLSTAVFCITFGSPMLGNESLSRAILHERWGGNFYHVVAQHDIVPRLLFAPTPPFILQLHSFFKSLQFSLTTPYNAQLAVQLSDENKAELFHTVLACLRASSSGVSDLEGGPFWPFGSYMFCTDRGSICMDNATAIVKLLYLMLATGSPNSCIEDHLKYDEYVTRACWQFLMRTSFIEGSSTESSYEAGIALALNSAGINSHVKSITTWHPYLSSLKFVSFHLVRFTLYIKLITVLKLCYYLASISISVVWQQKSSRDSLVCSLLANN